MSLADELEKLCAKADAVRSGSEGLLVGMNLAVFIRQNQDAILSALRGRGAVLEEAALACNNAGWSMPIEEFQKMTKREHSDRACHECAAAIRAMKEGKHV